MPALSPSAPAFILLFFLLLAFPAQAIQGASDGLLLWFHTVLPALAPAMICTRMLLLTGGDRLLMKPLRPLFQTLFSTSETGSFILLSGMLCGYPLGPALCTRAQKEHQITGKEAAYLLAFCSFPSPMFVAGYIPGQFPGPVSTVLLLFGIYTPALILAWAARRHFHLSGFSDFKKTGQQLRQTPQNTVKPKPADTSESDPAPECAGSQHADSLESVLYDVCDIMVLIGAYLMLFSILARFLSSSSWIPMPVSTALCAVLEMTTGIRQICKTCPPAVCLPACAACAAFGGISGIFQTRGVITPGSGHAQDRKNAGFDIRHYVGWKILHAGLSAWILTVLQLVLPPGFPPRW